MVTVGIQKLNLSKQPFRSVFGKTKVKTFEKTVNPAASEGVRKLSELPSADIFYPVSVLIGANCLNKSSKNLSDFEVDKLFKNNGFEKKNIGFKKELSPVENFDLNRKYGDMLSMNIERMYSSPLSVEKYDKFKKFLQWNGCENFEQAKKDFAPSFVTFSVLNRCNGILDYLQKEIESGKHFYEPVNNVVKNYPDCETLASIGSYKGLGFLKMNKALRNNNSCDIKVAGDIERISNYIETQKITKPLKVYRGEGFDVLKEVQYSNGEKCDLATMLVNATKCPEEMQKIKEFILDNDIQVKQKGFLSTTLNKNVAEDYADRGIMLKTTPRLIWELDVKPNSKAVLTEAVNLSGLGMNECELLFQKNSNILIKDMSYDNNYNLWTIKGEVSTKGQN